MLIKDLVIKTRNFRRERKRGSLFDGVPVGGIRNRMSLKREFTLPLYLTKDWGSPQSPGSPMI